jgi:hypothetical protein
MAANTGSTQQLVRHIGRIIRPIAASAAADIIAAVGMLASTLRARLKTLLPI